jgi:hypothetical protein
MNPSPFIPLLWKGGGQRGWVAQQKPEGVRLKHNLVKKRLDDKLTPGSRSTTILQVFIAQLEPWLKERAYDS